MNRATWSVCVLLVGGGALVAGCATDSSDVPTEIPDLVRAKAPATVWDPLAEGEPTSFIVGIAPADLDDSVALKIADRSALRQVWATAKQDLLAAGGDEVALEESWDELPLVQVTATSLEAAVAMLGRDEATAAWPIEVYSLSDAQTFDLIHQPAAAAGGFRGTGTSVAVLDTGADYTQPDLGSCTGVGTPSTCRVAYAQDFAASDSALDAHGHGTNVSAIVAGVATEAKILALDVFTGGVAYSNHTISAINWAVSNKGLYGIAALNLSLGGGSYASPCTSDAMGLALATARSAGIAPVVASGNDANKAGMASPGCAPASISVGAVYDANVGAVGWSSCTDSTTASDVVTCFSNSASFLTLLAPGTFVTAGGRDMSGTSQATPHVAGAMAVLRAGFPTESVDQLVARLTTTGQPVTDRRNGLVKPRIDLYAAVGAPPVDLVPPTASVSINAGAAATRTTAVTLTIDGSDNVGVASVCASNTTTCTAYSAFTTSKAWTLTTGEGEKTVTVWVKDVAGNTVTARDTIVLDVIAPTNGTATAAAGDGQVTLAWSGFADARSGLAGYRVVAATGTTAPTAACAGTVLYSGTASSFVHSGLVNGTTYTYRICAVDVAGNVSTGVTAAAAPRPESTPPTGSVVVNGGAAFTRTTAVTLTVTGTDASGVTSMCVSEATTCTAWAAFATSKTFTMAAGDRVHTVNVWLRDRWGNTATTPVSDSILLDVTAPTAVTVTTTVGSTQLGLAWTAATDAGSGVAGYRVMAAVGTTAPAAGCAAGTMVYSGAERAFTHTGLVDGTTYTYRICALDQAGNAAAGTTTSGAPRPEWTPPTGSILIASGASTTRTAAVTLTLAATDDTAVTAMCVSEATTCSAFVAYATTKAFTLAAGDRIHTVRVWYRDRWGNVAAPVEDSILLDTTAPAAITVAATVGSTQVALSWTASSDAGSGLAGYKVVALTGTTLPAAACATGAELYRGADRVFTHTGLTNGTTYSYRVCPLDMAGNVGAGVTAAGAPRPEWVAPSGSVSINAGADLTRTTAVTLSLPATDDSGVASACVGEGTTCTTFLAYSPTRAYTFAAGDRVRTVKVWYRDIWGNTSAPVSDTILLDTTAPAGVTVTSTTGGGTITLSWAAATDTGSGLAAYRVVYVPGTVVPAAACTTGTQIYRGLDRLFTHTGLTPGAVYSYRVCALDNAGNTSAGTTRTATAQ